MVEPGRGARSCAEPSGPALAEPTATVARVRRTINLVGRFLVTAGTLLLLFVGYQLWGTGIYESREQSGLQTDWDASIVAAREARAPVSGTTTTTAPAPPPPEGQPVGVIRIPKIGLERVVVQGVTVPDLRKGPGHYPDSPLPGQIGNAAIAGHRTTYGEPFNQLDTLVPGDRISVQTLNGTFNYTVTEQLIVSPRDVRVLDPTPDATLTLTTCHPKYSAKQRLIVKATLDVTQSPDPVAPRRGAVKQARLAVGDLTGRPESRTPLVWSGLVVAAVGGAWWFAFSRRKRWYTWVGGAIPFVAAYALFCFYMERVLPPGF